MKLVLAGSNSQFERFKNALWRQDKDISDYRYINNIDEIRGYYRDTKIVRLGSFREHPDREEIWNYVNSYFDIPESRVGQTIDRDRFTLSPGLYALGSQEGGMVSGAALAGAARSSLWQSGGIVSGASAARRGYSQEMERSRARHLDAHQREYEISRSELAEQFSTISDVVRTTQADAFGTEERYTQTTITRISDGESSILMLPDGFEVNEESFRPLGRSPFIDSDQMIMDELYEETLRPSLDENSRMIVTSTPSSTDSIYEQFTGRMSDAYRSMLNYGGSDASLTTGEDND